jgi:hypothetical protein
MYSGQFENVQSPISVFGWLTDFALSAVSSLAFSSVPSTPPQAASSVESPVTASPALPARPRKRRLDSRWASR